MWDGGPSLHRAANRPGLGSGDQHLHRRPHPRPERRDGHFLLRADRPRRRASADRWAATNAINPNYLGQANAYIFDPATLQWTVMLNSHGVPPLVPHRDDLAGWPRAGDRRLRPATSPITSRSRRSSTLERIPSRHSLAPIRPFPIIRLCSCSRTGRCWRPVRTRHTMATYRSGRRHSDVVGRRSESSRRRQRRHVFARQDHEGRQFLPNARFE